VRPPECHRGFTPGSPAGRTGDRVSPRGQARLGRHLLCCSTAIFADGFGFGDLWVPETSTSAQCPVGRELRVQTGGTALSHPHLYAHEFYIIGFSWEDSGSREDLVHPGAQKTPRGPNPPRYDAPRHARASQRAQVPATAPRMAAGPPCRYPPHACITAPGDACRRPRRPAPRRAGSPLR
jgi:hypothetical protein